MSLSVEECPRVETLAELETVTLKIPSEVRLAISPEDFWTLCARNPFARLERTGRGDLVVMSPSGFETGWLEMEIGGELREWAKRDRTGRVIGSNGGFTLPNHAIRAADVSWIQEDRWKALGKNQRRYFASGVPDLVIEICSPSDSRREAQAKMEEYVEQGVRLGWLIDARTPEFEVEVYRPGQAFELLKKPATVSGEDVLPGFVLELGKITANAD